MELNKEDIPSMNNIYDSKYWEKVKNDEQNRSNNMFNKSKNPFETGVVPNNFSFSSMYEEINDNNDDLSGDNDIVSSLSGKKISVENFSHNNMQPFIKGTVTQNTDLEKSNQKLYINTGVDQFYQKKKEVKSLFKPTSGYANVCSMKNNDSYYKNRINTSKVANNVFPIESIKVGPGLNKGFKSEPSGGFQQADTTQFVKPKSMEELRSKINQKESNFNIPMQAPIKGTDQRGIVSKIVKNRPETVYKISKDQMFKTTGANLRNTERPEENIKATGRSDTHIDYKGAIKYTDTTGLGTNDDYGINNIMVYNTERQNTENRTVVSNLTSIVKSMIAPILDGLKYTTKEYTIESSRPEGGNIRTQMPEKATLYDPVSGALKTTIKETTIHDTSIGNLKGTTNKHTVEVEQHMKTTVKETLPQQETTRNIGANVYKVYVYDPDSIVKTTTKETTIIQNSHQYGFLGGILSGLLGGYVNKDIDLKNTNKQFLSNVNEYGVAISKNQHIPMNRDYTENLEFDDTREKILTASSQTPNPGNMNLGVDKDDINMMSKKPYDNNISTRETGNIGVVYQTTPMNIDECSLTKNTIPDNAFKDRLDGSLLEVLKENELNININPIKEKCKL